VGLFLEGGLLLVRETQGPSFQESSLSDEEQTDGILGTNAVRRFSRDSFSSKAAYSMGENSTRAAA
jgi:hypothetical protein